MFSLLLIQAFPASRCGFSSRTCGTGLVRPRHSCLHDGTFPASLAPGCCAIPLSESALPSPLLCIPYSCLLHSQVVTPSVCRALRAEQQQVEALFQALWVMWDAPGFFSRLTSFPLGLGTGARPCLCVRPLTFPTAQPCRVMAKPLFCPKAAAS